MSQTAYNQNLPVGRAGMLADNTPRSTISGVNPVVAIPFGCAVAKGTADRDFKLPTAATDVTGQGKFRGIAIVDLSQENARDANPAQYAIGEAVAVLTKGRVYVAVEEAVAPTDPVYVRFANGVADNTLVQKGAFRKSPDGSASTAQVSTITPTAVNATIYAMEIYGADGVELIASAEYLSDGSATATEIVTGLKAALGTVPGIALSGTTTLILTASSAGVPFTAVNTGDGTLAVAATTPNVAGAATAALVPNARYLTTATAGNVAVVEINVP